MSTANLPALPSKQRPTGDIVRSIAEVFELGQILIRSGTLPSSIRTPEAAVAIILKGKELGIPPMEAFSGITVIQGKPTVSPQLMLSLIYRSREIQGTPRIEDDGTTCSVTMQRKGGEPHTETFSMEDAKRLQLAGKDNWIKQPKVMRKWRCIAACARVVFPDVIGGMYLHEELGATVSEEGDVIDVPPPEPPRPIPNNNSGFGRGQYASPEETDLFLQKFGEWIRKQNSEWLDKFADEYGEVHPDAKELMNMFQARGHMLKWCIATERIDPAIIPEDVKAGQKDKYLAIVYFRDQKAFGQEMKRYVEKCKEEALDVFYRKHPDLAPPEWSERQAHAEDIEVVEPPPRKKGKGKTQAAEPVAEPVEVVVVSDMVASAPEDEAWDANRM